MFTGSWYHYRYFTRSFLVYLVYLPKHIFLGCYKSTPLKEVSSPKPFFLSSLGQARELSSVFQSMYHLKTLPFTIHSTFRTKIVLGLPHASFTYKASWAIIFIICSFSLLSTRACPFQPFCHMKPLAYSFHANLSKQAC